jgi:DNA-binding transcriptional MocR family regulator
MPGPARQRGVLGDRAIALLVLLINIGRKRGRIFYSLDSLAKIFGRNKETIIELMKRLIKEGFVTKHRRSKLIGTPMGQRRVQDSNAYEVHMPRAGVGAASIIDAAASESDNPTVSSPSSNQFNKANLALGDKPDRWWSAEPYRMADGTYPIGKDGASRRAWQ